jgi:hypothetical protein
MQIKLIYIITLLLFSCFSYSKVINGSGFKYKDCINQLEVSNGKYCKIILSKNFQSYTEAFTRHEAVKISSNHNYYFKKLSNSEQIVKFSYQLLNYLSDKNIINPLMLARHAINSKEIVLIVTVGVLNHAGESIRLTTSTKETFQLINMLESADASKDLYSKEINKIFTLH